MNREQANFAEQYAALERMPVSRRQALLTGGLMAISAFFGGKTKDLMGAEPDENAEHKKLRKLWEAQDPMYEKIAEGGMQKYFDNLPDKDKAFFSGEELHQMEGMCSCCSDERITQYTGKDSDKKMQLLRTPGSGMLLAMNRADKNPYAKEFIESTAKEQLELGVTVFTAHLGCGAAKAVFNARILFLRMQGDKAQADALEMRGPDAWAHDWANAVADRMRAMAQELGVKHMGKIRADFIEQKDFKGPHFGRGLAMLLGKDNYNAAYRGVPQWYVEHMGSNLESDIDHANVLRQIAFDHHHSVGEFFNEEPKNQFLLVPIAATRAQINIVVAHAEKRRKTLGTDKDKVRVDPILY